MSGKPNLSGSNSGIVNSNLPLSFSIYLSSAANMTNAAWVEASALGTWTNRFDAGDLFASGRFTPGTPGVYLCGWSFGTNTLDQAERLKCELRRNGNESNGATIFGHAWDFVYINSDYTLHLTGSSLCRIFSPTDYISLWSYQDSGGVQLGLDNRAEFWGCYMGTMEN